MDPYLYSFHEQFFHFALILSSPYSVFSLLKGTSSFTSEDIFILYLFLGGQDCGRLYSECVKKIENGTCLHTSAVRSIDLSQARQREGWEGKIQPRQKLFRHKNEKSKDIRSTNRCSFMLVRSSTNVDRNNFILAQAVTGRRRPWSAINALAIHVSGLSRGQTRGMCQHSLDTDMTPTTKRNISIP